MPSGLPAWPPSSPVIVAFVTGLCCGVRPTPPCLGASEPSIADGEMGIRTPATSGLIKGPKEAAIFHDVRRLVNVSSILAG